MIDYVGFYGREGDPSRRVCSEAAVDKMNYIAEKLRHYDQVTIVSPSQTTVPHRLFLGKQWRLAQGVTLRTFASVGWTLRGLPALGRFVKRVQLFLYLLRHCPTGGDVVVYHSLYSMKPVMLAHRLRRFHLILEVEEIYQDVVDISPKKQALEYAAIADADAYLFSTEYLERKLNRAGKPFSIIYGNYRLAGRPMPAADGRTHVGFGGNLERSKGALLAAEAAALLPAGYQVHIAGSGPQADVEEIKKLVRKANEGTAGEKLRFEGNLSASAYEKLLQTCAVGLCSQDPTAKYSETSFPSKVLNYLRHGLKVVSIRIPAIQASAVAPAICFYDRNEARCLADAIMKATEWESTGDQTLARLDSEFEASLNTVLHGGTQNA